jgi:plastocyanin
MARRTAFAFVIFALAVGSLACGGGGSASPPTSMPPPPADVTITIAGIAGSMSYDPNPASVRVGQTVAWRNADSLPHTSSQTGSGGFETGTIVAGATSVPIRINTAGSLEYFCRIHPAMIARLDVTP